VRLDPELAEVVQGLADGSGRSLAGEVNALLRDVLEVPRVPERSAEFGVQLHGPRDYASVSAPRGRL
jgi:hypothetical protein